MRLLQLETDIATDAVVPGHPVPCFCEPVEWLLVLELSTQEKKVKSDTAKI